MRYQPLVSVLAIAMSLFCAPRPGLCGTNEWTVTGPEGGRVLSMAVSPSNPSITYAGTTGGMYKSTDAGLHWEPSAGWFVNPSKVHVNCIEIAAADPNVVYSCDIFFGKKTSDGGASWNDLTNGNVTSPPAGVDLSNISAIAIGDAQGDLVFAGTDTGYVLKSSDAGESWAVFSNGLPVDASVTDLFVNGGFVIAGYFGGGVFATPIGSDSWVDSSSGMGATHDTYMFKEINSTLFAVGDFAYKSSNGGSSWTLSNAGLPGATFWDIAGDPAQLNKLFLASSSFGLYTSLNGGTNWSELSPNITTNFHSDVFAVHADAGGGVLAATGGGGVHYRPAGSPWSRRGTGLTASQVDGVAAAMTGGGPLLYAATYGNGVYRSADLGQTWSLMSDGLNREVSLYESYNVFWARAIAVKPSDVSKLLLGSYDGIYRGTDGGTWQRVSNRGTYCFLFDPNDDDIIYAGTWRGVYRTIDGGTNWALMAGSPDDDVTDLTLAPQSGTILAASDMGLYTFDGAAWTRRVTGKVKAVEADPLTPGLVFAAGGELETSWVKKSIDGGLNWSTVGGIWNYLGDIYTILVDPADSTVYLGGLHGALVSVNHMQSWSYMRQGLTTSSISDLAVVPGSPSTIVAGIDGGGAAVYTRTAGPALGVSGTVNAGGAGLEGVLITATGSDTSSTSTNGSGDYLLSLAAGSYTLTPSKDGYSFTPAELSVTVTGSDVTGADFSAHANGSPTPVPTVPGCGPGSSDGDSDGLPDYADGCPADAGKTAAGICGCGVSDGDSNNDGAADCLYSGGPLACGDEPTSSLEHRLITDNEALARLVLTQGAKLKKLVKAVSRRYGGAEGARLTELVAASGRLVNKVRASTSALIAGFPAVLVPCPGQGGSPAVSNLEKKAAMRANSRKLTQTGQRVLARLVFYQITRNPVKQPSAKQIAKFKADRRQTDGQLKSLSDRIFALVEKVPDTTQ